MLMNGAEMPGAFKQLIAIGIPRAIVVKAWLEHEAAVAYTPGQVPPIQRRESDSPHAKGNSGIDTW